MPTFKAVVLSHQQRRDGTYNVKIRVTHNRKHKYIATPYYAGKGDLTRTLKLKNQLYIDGCEDLMREYRKKCDAVGAAITNYTPEQVCALLQTEEQGAWQVSFYDFAERFISTKRAEGTKNLYQATLKWIRKYAGDDVLLSDITRKWLQGLLNYIDEHKTAAGSTRGGAYIAGHNLKRLQAIYTAAQKEYNDEELGLVRLPFNPFSKIDIPKLPTAEKRAVPAEVIRAIATLPDDTRVRSARNFARDMFILSFALQGANFADMYEWTADQLKDGRITYKRKKTRERRSDEALISIAVQPEAQRLFEKYADPKGEFVFNFCRRFSSLKSAESILKSGITLVAKALNLDKLTFYAARHSWATIGLNDVGVDKWTIHEGLNHASGAMAITDVYIRKDWSRLDKANRAILDYVQLPAPPEVPAE